MTIVCDQRLKDYMAKKGYSCIAMEAINPMGCCAGMTELNARFLTPCDADRLRPTARKAYQTEDLELLILSREISVDEDVHLGLKSFLGAKDVSMDGIRAFEF